MMSTHPHSRPMSTGMKLLSYVICAHFDASRVVPSSDVVALHLSEAPGSKKEEDQVADAAGGLRKQCCSISLTSPARTVPIQSSMSL